MTSKLTDERVDALLEKVGVFTFVGLSGEDDARRVAMLAVAPEKAE